MILIIDNHSKNVPLIENILKKFNVKYKVFDQKTDFRNIEKNTYKGIIFSGGVPYLDEKIYFDAIKADISCMINYDIPILGICVGHEIIGEACGAELLKLKKPSWMPNLKVKILKKSKIFKGLPDEIIAYEHHERYLKNVPAELEIAATSRKDKVEAIFHKTRPIFGLQFHPEKSGVAGEKIFKNFVDLCYS
ncbi:MAG: gamma-glutamyl-gamma-aminobutyrate hydrolase family protein [Candidatus Aenigmarchaeota archaeon]|nr:gamma-glutamyl-gamma-aminobutyrate hydrolase family protein [Candidatus Aenigmarchaeota archaeon]